VNSALPQCAVFLLVNVTDIDKVLNSKFNASGCHSWLYYSYIVWLHTHPSRTEI